MTSSSASLLLKSTTKGVEDLVVEENASTVIGSHRNGRSKTSRLSRGEVRVELVRSEHQGEGRPCPRLLLRATDLKTKEVVEYEEGQHLKGLGYDYQITALPVAGVSKAEPVDVPKQVASNGKKGTKREMSLSESESESAFTALMNRSKKTKKSGDRVWTYDQEARVYVLRYLGGGETSQRVAAFDFDGTLSVSKSGAKFPKDGQDFKLVDKRIPQLIGDLTASKTSSDRHRFVIFSNQLGIVLGKAKIEHVKARIEGILDLIQVPCLAMICEAENMNRKPRPGMFNMLRDEFNEGVDIDMKASFYVGDAAGRKTAPHRDHSCADLLFSINTGLPFLTPEHFFAKKPIKPIEQLDLTPYTLPTFDPRSLRDAKPLAIELDAKGKKARSFDAGEELTSMLIKEYSSKSAIIVCTGLPGSGKSTFCDKHLKGLKNFERINRDQLKTTEKCLKEGKRLLDTNRDVKLVIDNTNTDLASRKKWLEIGKSQKVPLLSFHFDVTPDHAVHNNLYRKLVAKTGQPIVPIFVIKMQAKNLVPPTLEEGFDRVFKINFKPDFELKDREDKYFMYLCDK